MLKILTLLFLVFSIFSNNFNDSNLKKDTNIINVKRAIQPGQELQSRQYPIYISLPYGYDYMNYDGDDNTLADYYSFEDCYLYAWNSRSNSFNATFPGIQLSKLTNHPDRPYMQVDLYTYIFDFNSYDMFIVSATVRNESASIRKRIQTQNISVAKFINPTLDENAFDGFVDLSVDADSFNYNSITFDLFGMSNYLSSGYIDYYMGVMDYQSAYFNGVDSVTNSDYSYQNGYTNGYNDGYAQGKDDGYDLGYDDGELIGYNAGYNNAYDLGYDDGYDDGLLMGDNVLKSPFNIITDAMQPVLNLLNLEIAPNLKIGSIVLIPLALAIILFLLKGLIL